MTMAVKISTSYLYHRETSKACTMLRFAVVLSLICIIAQTEAGAKPCSSGADCAGDECCESSSQLDGKRQFHAAGYCLPLSSQGEHCFVRYQSGKPASMVYSCPCQAGLHCQGTGLYEIPLGQTGTCG